MDPIEAIDGLHVSEELAELGQLPQPETGLVPGGPLAQIETRLAGVVVAALKEAFDRDARRLDLEREALEAERQRAERALKLELLRQAADRETSRLRLLAGVAVALAGLALAFGQSLHLGGRHAALAAAAVVLSPLASAIGNVGIKRRGGRLDPLGLNGWAMLGGGVLLLAVSALSESWGATSWSGDSVFSILYLALFGTGFTFVTLTILLRELPAVTVSFISMIIPFGALALGAVFRDEEVTVLAVGGALLVVAGIAVAQFPLRR